jgi:hypothetical protein
MVRPVQAPLGPEDISRAFLIWLLGNIIIALPIILLELRALTERVRKSRRFVRKYW